jgi:hypothetical protein
MTITDRNKLGFADFGEVLWKESTDSRRLRMNWSNSFGQAASLVEPDL